MLVFSCGFRYNGYTEEIFSSEKETRHETAHPPFRPAVLPAAGRLPAACRLRQHRRACGHHRGNLRECIYAYSDSDGSGCQFRLEDDELYIGAYGYFSYADGMVDIHFDDGE